MTAGRSSTAGAPDATDAAAATGDASTGPITVAVGEPVGRAVVIDPDRLHTDTEVLVHAHTRDGVAAWLDRLRTAPTNTDRMLAGLLGHPDGATAEVSTPERPSPD